MRWSTPRELLWAIIGGQAIALVALWPTYYPYGQAPKVQPQQQSANQIDGTSPAEHRPSVRINPSIENQGQRGSEGAAEVSIFGIKPGEWLLSIVTLMLWGATVGLVRGADKTASAQLRAYISVETGANIRQSRRRRLQFEFRPVLRNNGLTPARNVRIISLIDVVPPVVPLGFNYAIPILGSGPLSSVTTIGPRQERFHTRVMGRYLSIGELRDVRRGEKVFHIWGAVFYDDIFSQAQHTNFSFIIFVGGKREMTIWHNTLEHNDST